MKKLNIFLIFFLGFFVKNVISNNDIVVLNMSKVPINIKFLYKGDEDKTRDSRRNIGIGSVVIKKKDREGVLNISFSNSKSSMGIPFIEKKLDVPAYLKRGSQYKNTLGAKDLSARDMFVIVADAETPERKGIRIIKVADNSKNSVDRLLKNIKNLYLSLKLFCDEINLKVDRFAKKEEKTSKVEKKELDKGFLKKSLSYARGFFKTSKKIAKRAYKKFTLKNVEDYFESLTKEELSKIKAKIEMLTSYIDKSRKFLKVEMKKQEPKVKSVANKDLESSFLEDSGNLHVSDSLFKDYISKLNMFEKSLNKVLESDTFSKKDKDKKKKKKKDKKIIEVDVEEEGEESDLDESDSSDEEMPPDVEDLDLVIKKRERPVIKKTVGSKAPKKKMGMFEQIRARRKERAKKEETSKFKRKENKDESLIKLYLEDFSKIESLNDESLWLLKLALERELRRFSFQKTNLKGKFLSDLTSKIEKYENLSYKVGTLYTSKLNTKKVFKKK